jgi:uncharacterized protein (DUF2336 family)
LATNYDITREEMLRSIDGPSWTARAKSVERIAAFYCRGGLDPVNRRTAEDAFRVLRYDGELLVRRLLAECLKAAAHLPRDIAVSLATDKPEIAAPFIAHSRALADHDLLAVLRDHPGPHRLAIAQRVPLSGQLSDALCRCGEMAVALAVLANEAASVTESTLLWLLGSDRERAALYEAIARRKLLPIGIGERLRAGADGAGYPASLHGGAGPRASPETRTSLSSLDRYPL